MSVLPDLHAYYMQAAMSEAADAFRAEEVPVGCIVVHNGRIIARAHNQREVLNDPTAHAEMIAITQAAACLENWRLDGVAIYVTLEPCLMCMGAILEARIDTLVFGAYDNTDGREACTDIIKKSGAGHKLDIVPNVMGAECKAILQGFFQEKRNNPAPRSM